MKLVYYVASALIGCLFSRVEADPNLPIPQCCPNNGTLTDVGLCKDDKNYTQLSLATQMCGANPAFLLEPGLSPNENFSILMPTAELLIIKPNWRVPRHQYCLATVASHSVAIVCFTEGMATAFSNNQGLGPVPTVICCIVSSVCLSVTLITYILVPKLRDLQGKCVLCMIASLLFAFIFLAIFQFSANLKNETACIFMASMVYVLFLFVFFWLNVISFNVWQSLIKPNFLRRLTLSPYLWCWYCLWGWGAPLFLLLVTLILHYTPGSHVPPGFAQAGLNCWFTSSKQIWLYFYGPISIILVLNLIMFAWCAVRIWVVGDATYGGHLTPRRKRSNVHRLVLHVKLFVVMGICWTFEPISGSLGEHPLWLVTDYINALQGVIILLLLVVFRKKARVGLAQKLPFLTRCCPNRWVTDDNENDRFSEDSSDEEEDHHQIHDVTYEQSLTNNSH